MADDDVRYQTKSHKKSKLMRKCCCCPLQCGAFLVAACIVTFIVLSIIYSAYNIMQDGNGNAERQVCWDLKREGARYVYEMAKRAQKAYERICNNATDNFRNISTPPSRKRGRRAVALRGYYENDTIYNNSEASEDPSDNDIPMLELFQSTSGSSSYRAQTPEDTIFSRSPTETDISETAKRVWVANIIEKTGSPYAPLGLVAPEGECSAAEACSMNDKDLSRLFEGDKDLPEVSSLRTKRKWTENMSYPCIIQAEYSKRLSYMYYQDALYQGTIELCDGIKKFYRNLDIANIIISSVFYIFAMVLLFGIAMTNQLLILLWMATFLFYFVFEAFFLYLRVFVMLAIYLPDSWIGLLVLFLIVYIGLFLFKYFVIFCFYWFLYTPAAMRMVPINNMQLIVSRRG